MKKTIILILLIILFYNCTDTDVINIATTNKYEILEKTINKNFIKWKAENINDYSFSCYLYYYKDVNSNTKDYFNISINVTNNFITSDFDQITEEDDYYYMKNKIGTIDDYFNLILYAINHEYTKIKVDFDKDYFYPTNIILWKDNYNKKDMIEITIPNFYESDILLE